MSTVIHSVSKRSLLPDILWAPSGNRKTWAILDGARDSRMIPALERSYLRQSCLFAGRLSPSLRAAAPHLVELDREDKFTRWLLDNGWGNSWGVFFQSNGYLEALKRHFREFLRVKTETGKLLLFRYYDPRVLRVYLPTCTQEELQTVFGPVDMFLVERASGEEVMQYRLVGRKLDTASASVDLG